MTKTVGRFVAALLALTLVAAACSDSGDGGAGTADTTGGGTGGDDESAGGDEGAGIDVEAIGLWDDGPCDESLPPLHVGLITTFESPVISLIDQATALEAAAEGFNTRGGANGACIQVTTCDDRGDLDRALECVRTLDEAGVHATVNDQGTAGQAEVSAAMAEAGIPRVATNVAFQDWGDQNAYVLDASGTGSTFLMPQALISAGVTKIGLVRIGSAQAGALIGILEDTYAGQAEFVADLPVPEGTTDFTQFILAAEDAGAEGIFIALGEQEAVQVIRAAQQLDSDLRVGAALGSFSHSSVVDFGDFAEQMVFIWSYPPATYDVPAYEVLRADFEAFGEENLRTENLKASPMRSWIGLYALLQILREDGTTDFTREGITAALDAATDVPMLGLFGDATWTPSFNHPGLFQRAGIPRWAAYEWDPTADAPDGLEGNWVEIAEFDFDEVLCGSPFGAPAETC